MSATHAPTVFLSAATVDLEDWRNLLDEAFREAGFHVLAQAKSFGALSRGVKPKLVECIGKSDCVIHLAGLGYGSHATDPFPGHPDFQCSWTQFEYYYGHQTGKPVIAFVCAPDLSRTGFAEEGTDAERKHKSQLQQAHRDRVASGFFTGTPLEHAAVSRAANRQVESVQAMFRAVAGALREVHALGEARFKVADHLTFRSSLHLLPPRPLGFVGRTTDLEKLRAMPASGTVLTGLRGMGGIGKTALGIVLAYEWLPRYPDAQLFLDGRGTQANPPSAGDLLSQVIQILHPQEKLPDDPAQLKAIYYDVLRNKKVLILLDNALDAAQAKPLIPLEDCALIVTSRHNFMLGNHAPYPVGRLPDTEATNLLRDHYAQLTDDDAALLVKICAGLPLALQIAGSHLELDASERNGTPNVAAYLKALRGGRLATLNANAPEAGEITISETLRLSEAQLPAAERAAWRNLGVFTASFDARAAQAIAGAEETMLDHFVRRSLLECEGADRYKLHDLAADYARAQLGEAPLTALHLAHARHFTAVGEEADQLYNTKGKHIEGLTLFDGERAQLEAAYAWLATRDDAAAAQPMIVLVNAVVYTGQTLRFHPRQRIAWLESQLRAARLLKDKRHEGSALGNLGNAYADLGDARKAIEYHEKALIIDREIGDRRGEGQDLGNLGLAYADLGDARKAIEYHNQRLFIAREIGDRLGEGNALGNLGLAHHSLGDARKAIEYYEQQLDITREIGDRRGEGSAMGNLGVVHKNLGDARKAIDYYEHALVIAREIGDRRGEGTDLWNSALAYDSLGNRAEAIPRADAALAIREAIEDPNAAKVRAKLAQWRGQA